MKIFDYKFLILLGLTLVVYFLYREVEILKKKVKKINKLENNDSNEKNSSNDNLILKEKNNDIIQIDLPPKPEIDEKEKNEIKLIENIVKNIEEDGNIENNNSDYQSDLKVINIPLKLQNEENEIVKEEILNDTSSNSENDNIRDYSNTSEKLEIYSNDDEDNSPSSMVRQRSTSRSRRGVGTNMGPLQWLPETNEVLIANSELDSFRLAVLLLRKSLFVDDWDDSNDEIIENLRNDCSSKGVHPVWHKIAESTPIFAQFVSFPITESTEEISDDVDSSFAFIDPSNSNQLAKTLETLEQGISEASVKIYDYIHCYINIPDTGGRDSLYQAEARQCKNILENIENNSESNHFCVFDELYSGTNPDEAITSAYGYLNYLNN